MAAGPECGGERDRRRSGPLLGPGSVRPFVDQLANPLRSVDPAQGRTAVIHERQAVRQSTGDEVAHGRRHEDLIRLGQPPQASRSVDGRAVPVAVALDGGADVDAGPDADDEVTRPGLGGQGSHDVGGSLQGRSRIGERGERAVALPAVLDEVPTGGFDHAAHDLVVAGHGGIHGERVKLPEASRPHDVGEGEAHGSARSGSVTARLSPTSGP